MIKPATDNQRPATNSSAGFTLMELVVVLAIMAVTALLVVPKLPATDSTELRRSARALAATLRYLQDRSITAKTPHRIRFKPGTSAVSVSRLTQDGEERTGEAILDRPVLAEGVQVMDVFTPHSGRQSDGEITLDFGPGGIADFVTIHLRSAKGAFFTVMAYPASGKVTALDGYQEEAR